MENIEGSILSVKFERKFENIPSYLEVVDFSGSSL